jgi:hypothetical protein
MAVEAATVHKQKSKMIAARRKIEHQTHSIARNTNTTPASHATWNLPVFLKKDTADIRSPTRSLLLLRWPALALFLWPPASSTPFQTCTLHCLIQLWRLDIHGVPVLLVGGQL